MAGDTRDLRFRFIGEDSSLGRALRGAGDDADRTSSRLSGLGAAMGGLAVGGAVALGAGLVSAFRGGLEELKDNETAMAQFKATLKSTGNVANLSAGEMQKLADSIEAKTGTDGAAVVSGAAMLGTFTKVRNEVGKGNDVFNRATQAGVDLAAKGFGSVESNAVLLGKALNDPVKGLAALGKQGVTFTAGQKETIKSLVATGDTLGAQKLILAEIEGQVGGSAAAYGQTLPGQLARAQAAFDGVKETVVKALLPALIGVLEFTTTTLIPGFQRFADQAQPAFDAVKSTLTQLRPTLEAVGSAVAGFVQSLPVGVLVAFGVALGLAFFPFTTIALLVAGAVAALQVAYNRFESVRTVVQAVGQAIGAFATVAAAGFAAVSAAATEKFGQLRAYVMGIWPQISQAAQNVFNALRSFFSTVLAAYQALWSTFGGTLTSFVRSTFSNIQTVISGVLTVIRGVVQTVLAAINGNWSQVFSGLRTIASGALTAVSGVVSQGFAVIRGLVSAFGAALGGLFRAAWAVLTGIVSAAFGAAAGAVSAGIGQVAALLGGLRGRITGAVAGFGSLLVNAGRELMAGLASGIGDKIASVVGKVREAAAQIKRLLPGSPVKDGPLTAWNRGAAGVRLMNMLASGVDRGAPAFQSAMQRAVDVGDIAGMNVGGPEFVSGRLGLPDPSATASTYGGGRSMGPITVVSQIDGREVARATVDPLRRELAQTSNRNGGTSPVNR